MSTLGDAKLPTLREKLNAQELNEVVKNKEVKVKKVTVGASKRVKTKVGKITS